MVLRVRTLGEAQCQHRYHAPQHLCGENAMRCSHSAGSRCPGLSRTRAVQPLTRALPSRPHVETATPTSTPERVTAPLLEALVARAFTPAAALHVPGHKVCFLTLCHYQFIDPTARDGANPKKSQCSSAWQPSATPAACGCCPIEGPGDSAICVPPHIAPAAHGHKRAYTVALQFALVHSIITPGRAVERIRRTRRLQR